MGLIPLGILNFVLKWRSAQKRMKSLFVCLKRSTKSLATAINPTNVSLSDKMSDTNHDS